MIGQIVDISVVFPAPFGPSKAMISPCFIFRYRFFTAKLLSYFYKILNIYYLTIFFQWFVICSLKRVVFNNNTK